MVFSNRGSRRRGQAPALRRRHVCHNQRGISAAWHRWRPGGRTRYSAAAVRACGVIPMRAARGAAAPVTQVNTGPPPKPSEAGSVGRGGTVEGVSFAACGEANDLELVPTKRAAMRGWSLPCPYIPPPPWAPVWGSMGQSPRPFFSPISLGRNGGAVVGPSCGSFASGQARKLIPSAGPPLPTTTTPLGRRGGPIGRAPRGAPPADGRPQVAPTDAGG